jgi:pimeloyl-ACP methyl ester carboxylesterase
MTTTTTSRSGTITVPGGSLAYDVAGDGPPLVLVHAGITDRRMWDDVWDDLAADHTVIRYDTRGYGDTRILDATPYSNRADLIAVLDELGLDRAAVCGVSRSGTIVIDTAVEFPDRIGALIPVAAGLGGFEVPVTPEEEAAFTELEKLEQARDWEPLVEGEMRVWVDGLTGTPDRVPEVRRRAAEMDLRAYREHADEPEAPVITLEPRAAGRIADLRIPTLVIVGDMDTPETVATCRHIAVTIPGARLVVLSGVAHLPPMERPGEFASLLREFVASASS